ncbi:MAG: winged helix-turn-helix transcriptional regulator [Deltaproteobacteria bacterium]|jgi:ATP-dependent DNA helicase RecG|nr:winged helix-turn-helix transcriptional regulator [Deltaproteobacteria bacterium]
MVDVIKENPTATIPTLARLTGKSLRTVSRQLRQYQEAGLIYREGARKKGRWLVK